MTRAALLIGLFATPTVAGSPVLNVPLDCRLGDTCFIQQYTDADPGPGAADYTCGPLSYDGHKGTDFALPALSAIAAGVDVHPAAPGTVVNVRDGMPDIPQNSPDAPDVAERECGNGVVLRHGDGWETQYCHMKRGSITVRRGQRVSNATVIGQVGLSGQTEFPHLHLSVRHDGKVVDPFNATGNIACGQAPEKSLWQQTPDYRPGGLISAGFASGIPEYQAVRAGTAAASGLAADGSALVLWGFAFGGRAGDTLVLRIDGPEGEVLSQTVALDKAQAQFFRAVGRRTPPGGWQEGTYSGTIRMMRRDVSLGERRVAVSVAR